MNSYHTNPDGPENTAATLQHRREVFALKMQQSTARTDFLRRCLAAHHQIERTDPSPENRRRMEECQRALGEN